MTTERNCWTVLAQRAQDEASQIQTELGKTLARLESLNASKARLEKLYEDYRQQENTTNHSLQGMREVMNQRQFMSQLLTLRQRVERDIGTSQLHLQTLAHRMLQAEAERLKMKTLTENDRLAVQKHVLKREQLSMDELGMLQFNQVRAA
jgi:flagellar export protein FliJ